MDMMKAILDIEKKAQEIENSTCVLMADISRETDKNIQKIAEETKKNADAKIEEFRNKEEAFALEVQSAVKAENEKTFSSLEEKFAKDRAAWISGITDEIIKGDGR